MKFTVRNVAQTMEDLTVLFGEVWDTNHMEGLSDR
ncbi:hypothetical protein TheveDRAFT_1782 [Thermanaerovibrio velox DSM 12556]|uniref:Uncharacterized protein n=1 Tax=Thermanaerovibrio velox DSM 12556 TaxID=926567 RepID=H0UR63_9BACT|nr:hypothetical protein TheveDRAFT_1782 [Thermanaerovibrio velox DSM 12556]